MNSGSIRQLERLARVALVGLLVVGCCLVLWPFLSAILFAIVIAISTRPAFRWSLERLNGKKSLASFLCCCGVVLALVGPATLLAISAADAGTEIYGMWQSRMAAGPIELPEWVGEFPLIGPSVANFWRELTSGELGLTRTLQVIAEPARELALRVGGALGGGVLQLILAVFLLYFLYRDGHEYAGRFERAFERVAGPDAAELIAVAQNTVRSVMLGMVGTAVAQSLVATLGFAIAGAPAPLLLGAATFVASPVPFGPPIVWGGAALWLYANGETGWAIFTAIYGAVVISSVDNVLKPFLISRGSGLSLATTLLGVLGGVIAFGFMGLFIGPTLLALALNVGGKWLDQHAPEDPAIAELAPSVDPPVEPLANAPPPDPSPKVASPERTASQSPAKSARRKKQRRR